jgi:hypothetical protein
LAGPGAVPATGNAGRQSPAAGLDVAGLAQRIVPFPVPAGRYEKLGAAKDGVVWLELPRAGRPPGPAASHQQALTLLCDLRQRLGEARALHDLGVVRQETGDYPAKRASANWRSQFSTTIR